MLTMLEMMGAHFTVVTTLWMVCNHNIRTVDDHPDDGGWPSLDWWVTLLGMVFNHPGDCSGPLFGKWVTIFWKVGDHILDGE